MLLITSTTEGEYPSDSVGMAAAVTDCSFVNGSASFARQVWPGMRTCDSGVNMVWESMWEVWMTARVVLPRDIQLLYGVRNSSLSSLFVCITLLDRIGCDMRSVIPSHTFLHTQPGGASIFGFQLASLLNCSFEGNVGGVAALVGEGEEGGRGGGRAP